MRSLVIVGAGPKAVAVQAKAHVLRGLGMTPPEIRVVDPLGMGGNWLPPRADGPTGGAFWSLRPSRTSASLSHVHRRRPAVGPGCRRHAWVVDRELLALSWVRFLMDTGRYASWIDRDQPRPQHRLWAEYLCWVAAGTGLNPIRSRVTGLHADAAGWSLSVSMIDGWSGPSPVTPCSSRARAPAPAASRGSRGCTPWPVSGGSSPTTDCPRPPGSPSSAAARALQASSTN